MKKGEGWKERGEKKVLEKPEVLRKDQGWGMKKSDVGRGDKSNKREGRCELQEAGWSEGDPVGGQALC